MKELLSMLFIRDVVKEYCSFNFTPLSYYDAYHAAFHGRHDLPVTTGNCLTVSTILFLFDLKHAFALQCSNWYPSSFLESSALQYRSRSPCFMLFYCALHVSPQSGQNTSLYFCIQPHKPSIPRSLANESLPSASR